jgi:hypothetical protein
MTDFAGLVVSSEAGTGTPVDGVALAGPEYDPGRAGLTWIVTVTADRQLLRPGR